MSLRTSIKRQYFVSLISIFALGVLPTASHAQSVSAPGLIQSNIEPSTQQATSQQDSILKIFEREAHAAYQEAKRACASITSEQDKEVCLAKARLQYDADMRYAKQRAAMGH